MNKVAKLNFMKRKATQLTSKELENIPRNDLEFIVNEEISYLLQLIDSLSYLDSATKLNLFSIATLNSQQLSDCSLGILKEHQKNLKFYFNLVNKAIASAKKNERKLN